MNVKVFEGEVASQPVVVPIRGHVVAMVLVKTADGYQKFYCYTYKHDDPNGLLQTIFSNVVVSSIGDNVRFEVPIISCGYIRPEIISFENLTRKIIPF